MTPVVWITGAPSSGKSTLARSALERLRAEGVPTVLLDGDEVRACIIPEIGYGPAARDAFYATLANVAAMLARQSLVVLVAATAQRREFRERARGRAPAFLEVWVATPLEECARRDTKGLYAASLSGAITEMPGVNVAYEPPEHPDVVAQDGQDAKALGELCERVRAMV